MDPKDFTTAAGKAHAAADKVYQTLTRPDRPIAPEPEKKPWLAAFLSALIVGAGQLYNRQLPKAILLFFIFYIVGALLLLMGLLLNWIHGFESLADWLRIMLERILDLSIAFRIIWPGLWLFAVIDAYRIAAALRSGRLVVRYGFFRQTVYGAASFIPVAGALVPSETVTPEEVNQSWRGGQGCG